MRADRPHGLCVSPKHSFSTLVNFSRHDVADVVLTCVLRVSQAHVAVNSHAPWEASRPPAGRMHSFGAQSGAIDPVI